LVTVSHTAAGSAGPSTVLAASPAGTAVGETWPLFTGITPSLDVGHGCSEMSL
jgi:hypothetical protein